MKTIIIADNLVNDYCGTATRFTQRNVNIGLQESERIFGADAKYGQGPFPIFLRHQIRNDDTHVLFCRDSYSPEEPFHQELLEQQGEHCIKNTAGEDFPAFLKELTAKVTVMDCAGLIIPLSALRNYLQEVVAIDLYASSEARQQDTVRFLLLGFHTERRIFNTANMLRNLFGFPVAVFSHFLASSNREFHFNALRYQFPDNRISVFNNVPELEAYLECDLAYLKDFNLQAVHILPKDIQIRMSDHQRRIVESICMHWTEAHLKPLGGGFSGSALFLANGRQGASKTEPMVIKIDKHPPIQMEIRGYNLVKDFLGKHVPTFTFPVSDGGFMGIGMELAAMEGPPSTLQDHFEKAQDDYGLDAFLQLLERTLVMLTNRVYHNTFVRKLLAPFRHFSLHISQQEQWLKGNLENLQRHKTDNVFVSDDVLVNIFNLIRKNSDAIFSDLCIGHGDLNLANIIVDDQGNLWTIDWTHTGYHPLSIDFAKMENDVKFIISKEIAFEDLPKLQILEEYLLAQLVPPPLGELPDHLHFVKWDLRFKKIYRTVRRLRSVYSSLKQDEDWLVYKIALLRFGLHTLSFDKTMDWGECTPPQLWYTLISMETLLFQLVADDYHLKIRSERPEFYPERQRLQIDVANWEVPCPEYSPPYFVTQEVLDGDRTQKEVGYADPEEKWDFEDFIDWGRSYSRDKNKKPLNPSGRTGIAGRGSLWLWGPNPMIFFIPIRYDKQSQQLEVLLQVEQDSSSELVSVHLRRDEPLNTAIERGKSKLIFDPDQLTIQEVHQGYLYDPRQTDNAWIEAKAYLIFLGEEGELEPKTGKEYLAWKTIDPTLINEFYSSYAFLLRKGIQYIYDESLVREPFVAKILEKTG